MAENMFCKDQKANNKKFRDNFPRTFRGNQDIPYPEEKRDQEIKRRLKEAKRAKRLR